VNTLDWSLDGLTPADWTVFLFCGAALAVIAFLLLAAAADQARRR
jgi:hypothetical protein